VEEMLFTMIAMICSYVLVWKRKGMIMCGDLAKGGEG